MRNRANLVLMEQLIMLLVFSLAAAACLGIFSAAHGISQSVRRQDDAVILVQNGAEIIKNCTGDLTAAAQILPGTVDGNTFTVCYGSDLLPSIEGCYILSIHITDSQIPGLGQATLSVIHRDMSADPLFSLIVAWQEVA